jgi:hypothetical protein
MLKTILISTVMGLNITYPSMDVCKEALAQVQPHDAKAICLPAGENKQDQMFSKFMGMVKQLQQMEKQNKQKNNSYNGIQKAY